MTWIKIKDQLPSDGQNCTIKTNLDNEFDANYYDEWGTFFLDEEDKEIGLIITDYAPEIVVYWQSKT